MTTFAEDHAIGDICPNFEQIRLENSMPDLTIKGQDGRKVNAHRIVMGSRFPCLKEQLSGRARKANTNLCWPRISTSTIEAMVSFAYSGRITLTSDNATRVFLLALSLRCKAVQQFCMQFFTDKLSMNYLETLWPFAKQIKLDDLKKICLDFMISHFGEVCNSNLFLSLDVTTLMEILPAMRDEDERTYLAISAWVDQDISARSGHLAQLATTIRWERISSDFLFSQIASNSTITKFLESRKQLTDIVQAVVTASNSKSADVNPKSSDLPTTYLFGLPSPDSKQCAVVRFNTTSRETTFVATMPCSSFSYFEVIQDNIYFMGARIENSASENIIQFNPQSLELAAIGKMPIRQYAKLAVHQGSIFQIGGMESGKLDKPVQTVDVFDTKRNLFYGASNMINKRAHHAVACSTHEILVCGGSYIDEFDRNIFNKRSIYIDSCEMYDINANRWIRFPRLQTGRYDAVAIWLPNGRIFVFGGYGSREILSSVEMSNRKWNSVNAPRSLWCYATPMPNALQNPKATMFHDVILVVGSGGYGTHAPCLMFDAGQPGQWTTLKDIRMYGDPNYILCNGDELFTFASSSEVIAFKPPAKTPQTKDFRKWNWVDIATIECLYTIFGVAVISSK